MIVCLLISTAAIRRRWPLIAGGLLVVALACAAVWYGRPPRPNIVLVTFDTTRADRLGAYGYASGATAGFDEFAQQGVIFENAYAPAPITLPSHATMLTGLYPPEHGLRVNGSGRLGNEIPILSEILKREGYETGAFIAAVVLDSMYGLDRGFDVYDDDVPRSAAHHGERRRDGKQVVDAALAWLKQRTTAPFFCWIHLYDAHAPYDPRSGVYGQKFAEHPYDAGVAWEVEQFARVTAWLKERQLADDTVVIVAGDHGEGLGEHQEFEHGMLVYNTTLEVPLAFVGPAHCRPGTRVSTAVSLVDLMPTVLDILRIPAPASISGRSLLPALGGEQIAARDCYAEAETPYSLNRWAPLRAVISSDWKYIRTTRPELYDLAHDPEELTNLADSDAETSRRLSALLQDLEASFVIAAPSRANLSEDDLANLRALGYVSGGDAAAGGSTAQDLAGLPDVKDFLPQVAQFEAARHLALEGRLDEAIALSQAIVQVTRDFPAAEMLLGDCLAKVRRFDDAAATYRSLLERHPDFERVQISLGRVLVEQGQYEQAADEFRGAIRKSPESAVPHLELAGALTRLERFKEAIEEYRTALRLAPESAGAHVALGQLLAALGRPVDAAMSLEQALRYEPDNVAAHEQLLIVLSQTGEFSRAIRHGEKAVALNPQAFETRFNLGILLVSQGRFADGIAQLRAAQELRPDDPRPGQQIQQAEAALQRGGR